MTYVLFIFGVCIWRFGSLFETFAKGDALLGSDSAMGFDDLPFSLLVGSLIAAGRGFSWRSGLPGFLSDLSMRSLRSWFAAFSLARAARRLRCDCTCVASFRFASFKASVCNFDYHFAEF